MITCKDCKKFAKLKATFINGADEVKLAGSCKHCGYDERDTYPKETKFSEIPDSRIDYTDFEELGIDRCV
jgi:RNase P subunit RPR2